jgi:hypothetical protein
VSKTVYALWCETGSDIEPSEAVFLTSSCHLIKETEPASEILGVEKSGNMDMTKISIKGFVTEYQQIFAQCLIRLSNATEVTLPLYIFMQYSCI